ncbi:hypothetical protein BCR34DRAFT_593099 [Clohesyomyces aquaticus]|uniref:Uncharacterized protein n=1 Tax=Clohesyomyces aquaticus TaxID=1231657 RepID=A0A1Y1YL90_9PLEO|nr:hypothetical protein BCR34DRAFT_593099 [Clohesyomyces aquaticus]
MAEDIKHDDSVIKNQIKALVVMADPTLGEAQKELLKSISDENLAEIFDHVWDRLSRQSQEELARSLIDHLVKGGGNGGGRSTVSKAKRRVSEASSTLWAEGNKRESTAPGATRGTIEQGHSEKAQLQLATLSDAARLAQAPSPAESEEERIWHLPKRRKTLQEAGPIDRGHESDINTGGSWPKTEEDRDTSRRYAPADNSGGRPTGNNTNTTTSDIKRAKVDYYIDIAHIDIVFFVPRTSIGKPQWRKISRLPKDVQKRFYDRFNEEYQGNDSRKETFGQITRNPSHWMTKGQCLNYMVLDRHGVEGTWVNSNGNKKRACDKCVRMGRPCANLVKLKNGVQFGIYPIHEAVERGDSWDQLSFWFTNVWMARK